MDRARDRNLRRVRRKRSLRKRIMGTPDQPRLTVYRSLKHMYAQIIDDLSGRTLVSAGTRDKDFSSDDSTGNVAAAAKVGTLLASRAKKAGVGIVTFDRNGLKYHGRVKALAEAARKEGLKL